MRSLAPLILLFPLLLAGCGNGAIGRTPAEVQEWIPYAKQTDHLAGDVPMRDGSKASYDVRFYKDRVYDFNHETRQWTPVDVVYVAEFTDGRCSRFQEQSTERAPITVQVLP